MQVLGLSHLKHSMEDLVEHLCIGPKFGEMKDQGEYQDVSQEHKKSPRQTKEID